MESPEKWNAVIHIATLAVCWGRRVAEQERESHVIPQLPAVEHRFDVNEAAE